MRLGYRPLLRNIEISLNSYVPPWGLSFYTLVLTTPNINVLTTPDTNV